MMFAYKNNLKMDDRYRIENPLGFQVTGYRVDNDYSTASPRQPLSSSMEVDAAVPVHAAARQEEAAPPFPDYVDDGPAADEQQRGNTGARPQYIPTFSWAPPPWLPRPLSTAHFPPGPEHTRSNS